MCQRWELVATCNPGLEEVALEEMSDLGVVARPFKKGSIMIEGGAVDLVRLNYLAKTLHRIAVILTKGEVDGLDGIYEMARSIDYRAFFSTSQSFAVRSSRVGEHPFTSMDIARVIGQAVIDTFLEAGPARPPVDLSDPDVTILAELRDRYFWMGIDTTGESLHRRWYRRFTYITALKSTIAHSMVRLSGFTGREVFLDPMCGTGTIPIEAYHYLAGTPNRGRTFAFERLHWFSPQEIRDVINGCRERDGIHARIIGFDVDRRVIERARANAQEASSPVRFFVGDARRIPVKADIVCVDLPYGVRLRRINLPSLYSSFFANLRRSRCKRIVFITARRSLRYVPRLYPFRVVRHFDVNYCDLEAKIIVAERMA